MRLWKSLAENDYANVSVLELEREVQGVIPGRKFRYDFKVVGLPVLIEIHGGTYSRGKTGHNSGKGIFRDAEKVNGAQFNGYYIFVFTVDMLKPNFVKDLYTFCLEIS